MNRRFFATHLALAAVGVPAWSQTAPFPSKPIKFVVPYAPGGLPDTIARIVAQKLGERIGQSVVIDNKPGGNGVVAYQTLLGAPNDGHTFIVSDGSMLSITPMINKSANFTVGKDLRAVSLLGRSPLFLVSHPKTGVNTFQEFIDQVRRKPGAFTYGSSGLGSSHHLTMEALKAELKLDIRHVPFRGSSQSVPALVGGQVEFLFSALPSVSAFAKAGQITLLASNDAKRSSFAPEIPAIAEFVRGFNFAVTVGVLARSETSDDIVKKLSDEIQAIVKQSDVVSKFVNAGTEAIGAGPLAYKRAIDAENMAMAKASKTADLKTDF